MEIRVADKVVTMNPGEVKDSCGCGGSKESVHSGRGNLSR